VTTGNLLHTINNPTPQSGDYFGYRVAISGNTAIVGAHQTDTVANGTGSAYIYDVSTGNLLHTLNNPTPQTDDYFGVSVSISGDRAIVGASSDNTGLQNAGSAYIYDVTTGALLHTINNPTPQIDDYFGNSVAIDGNTAIVGAYKNDVGWADAGSVYIYDVTTGALLHTINNPTPQYRDSFGYSVAISGNHVIVGAYDDITGGTNAGSAYIYDVTTGALLHTINNPTPQANDRFGYNVAIDGINVIVGAYSDDTGATDAGSAYIYK
jgi:WD40 repeat protein